MYRPQCLSIGRIVSGDVPNTATLPYRGPELYTLGGAPNYAAIAVDGLVTCDTEAVSANSLVGSTGDPMERIFAAFSEQCPGLLNMQGDGDPIEPQALLVYECSQKCVDWMINFGVCAATDLQEVRCSKLLMKHACSE